MSVVQRAFQLIGSMPIGGVQPSPGGLPETVIKAR